jgi:hypothetical protein
VRRLVWGYGYRIRTGWPGAGRERSTGNGSLGWLSVSSRAGHAWPALPEEVSCVLAATLPLVFYYFSLHVRGGAKEATKEMQD